MGTKRASRWRNRQERESAVLIAGRGFRAMAPKLDTLSAFTGTDATDLSRWTRGQRDGGKIGYCVDALAEAVRCPKGSPGALIGALLEVAVEIATQLDSDDLDARIVAACRRETEAQGPEDLCEFDLLDSLGTPRFVEAARAYLPASTAEIAAQTDAVIFVRARLRQMGVSS